MTNILERSVGRVPAAEASVYRQAVQEFDWLWERREVLDANRNECGCFCS